MNLMQYDYIPPVDIKTEPYIPETGTQNMRVSSPQILLPVVQPKAQSLEIDLLAIKI